MKKKIISVVLALSMFFAIALTGCGSSKNQVSLYDYDLSEYITVGEYVGLVASPIDVVISSEDIKIEIDSRLAQGAINETITEGTISMGDTINIDFVGTIDGEEFAGGSTEGRGTTIVLGQAGYIDGFEKGLDGATIGETVVLDLRFPDNYGNADVAGKDCQFSVTINNKQSSVLPTYDLEFVKEYSEFDSLAEYEQSIYEELFGIATENAEINRENELWNQIVENSEVIKYPEKEIKDVRDGYEGYINSMIQYYNQDMESYLSLVGMTQEEFDQSLDDYAKDAVKNEMIMFSIARAEGFDITDEEYKAGIDEILLAQGFESDEQFKAQYGQSYEEATSKDSIITNLLLKKVMEFIVENCVEAN